MRVLITRPEADAIPLAEHLGEAGIESLVESMLTISPAGDADLPLDGVQALLVTSANGARALAAATARRDLPLYAVGDASARAARAEGFATVVSAAGDVEALARTVAESLDPRAGALLHAAGTALAGDLAGLLEAAGFALRRVTLYRAEAAAALSADGAGALRAGDLDAVLFFSPRTARTFVRLVRDAALAESCARIDALCLSPAVAEAAGALPWRRLRVAAKPDQESLLALLHGEG